MKINNQNPILCKQERSRAFVDRGGDFPHTLGSGVGLGNEGRLVGREEQCDHSKYWCQINHACFTPNLFALSLNSKEMNPNCLFYDIPKSDELQSFFVVEMVCLKVNIEIIE